MTTWPNIGLQRTSACGLAAEAGSLGGEGRIVSGSCHQMGQPVRGWPLRATVSVEPAPTQN
jgi:hypothetical protein